MKKNYSIEKDFIVIQEKDIKGVKKEIKITYEIDTAIFYPRIGRHTKYPELEYLQKVKIIYILFYKNEIVYVGQGSLNRITSHSKKYHWKWNYYRIIPVKNKNIRLLMERLLIYKYKPKYNKE